MLNRLRIYFCVTVGLAGVTCKECGPVFQMCWMGRVYILHDDGTGQCGTERVWAGSLNVLDGPRVYFASQSGWPM
jgi:hypothetical protein